MKMEVKKETKRKFWHRLSVKIMVISIIPLLVLGIIIMIFSDSHSTDVVMGEVEVELTNLAETIELSLDFYDGEYTANPETLKLYKGTEELDSDYIIQIAENTGYEISVFYGDIRYITTLVRSDNSYEKGTRSSAKVYKDVQKNESSAFYESVTIYDEKYVAFYMPLTNSDGSVVGMLGIARKYSSVNDVYTSSGVPIIILSVISMIIAAAIVAAYMRTIMNHIGKINVFLNRVAKGELHKEMNENILKRDDELGDIGRSAVDMQKSLQVFVEQDALTTLYNRRTGEKLLSNAYKAAIAGNNEMFISIGDIDFFKKVNDTYGHETGDVVLRSVAKILKDKMRGYGFVARWGGEEFLLVFEKADRQTAVDLLNDIRVTVMNNSLFVNGGELVVTMTFGINSVFGTMDYNDAVAKADVKLYEGKQGGRNQVVE